MARVPSIAEEGLAIESKRCMCDVFSRRRIAGSDFIGILVN